ncbi:MAG: hypothetical protein ABWX59_00425 [Microbacteriaceae bacterium]
MTQRLGNAVLLATGLAVTLAGIAWLSQITAATPYLTGVALPMVLLGVGQGPRLRPAHRRRDCWGDRDGWWRRIRYPWRSDPGPRS